MQKKLKHKRISKNEMTSDDKNDDVMMSLTRIHIYIV